MVDIYLWLGISVFVKIEFMGVKITLSYFNSNNLNRRKV
jgi:hypothetical protein